jgi:hypothetical protein
MYLILHGVHSTLEDLDCVKVHKHAQNQVQACAGYLSGWDFGINLNQQHTSSPPKLWQA